MLDHKDDVINLVCSGLPIYKSKCQEILEELLGNLTGKEVCTKLDLCQQTTAVEISGCDECKFVSTYLCVVWLLRYDSSSLGL